MDASALKDAGLTDGEIKVYLALIELGLSTTGTIIKKSGVAKSIVYQILEKLTNKGLVSQIIKEKTKHFQAASPNKILDYVDEKKRQVEKSRIDVEKLLPELLAKQNYSPKSETTMYFGFKGIRTAHENLYEKLKEKEEYYYLGIPSYQPKEQHLYWKKDHIRRIKSGIGCKFLYNLDTARTTLKERNSYRGCDARYMPSQIKTPATFLIYKDTVTIILQSPSAIAVEIVNQEISDSFKAYFNEFWNRSKPFR